MLKNSNSNPAEQLPSYRVRWLARLVYSRGFEFTIAGVIFVNAIALGTLTMPGLSQGARESALAIENFAFAIYVVELTIRIVSYGKKPWMFFSTGWNIFDFIVIGLSPFFQGQSTILRLLRLLRLIRIFRFLPEVRLLSTSIIRSIPPLLSMSVLVTLLLFLYGMAGVYLFGTQAQESWGNIASSMKSLFILLTLENFPVYFEEGLEISPLALPFFLSYVFLIVFTVLNVLIGIVLNAMDEVREEEKAASQVHGQMAKIITSLEQVISDGVVTESELETLKSQLKRLKEMKNSKP
jgi:voltage-gated sodium channel